MSNHKNRNQIQTSLHAGVKKPMPTKQNTKTTAKRITNQTSKKGFANMAVASSKEKGTAKQTTNLKKEWSNLFEKATEQTKNRRKKMWKTKREIEKKKKKEKEEKIAQWQTLWEKRNDSAEDFNAFNRVAINAPHNAWMALR